MAGPDAARARREYLITLLAGAAGAGLMFLAARESWAHVVYLPPRPLPSESFAVTGQQLVPAVSGLAIGGLACLAGVLASRGLFRRVIGGLLVACGIGAAIASTAAVTAGAVLSARTGSYPGVPGRAEMAGPAWRIVAIAGAVILIAAGLATVIRGPRWPVLSSRYERGPAAGQSRSSAGGAAVPAGASSGANPGAGSAAGSAGSSVAGSAASPAEGAGPEETERDPIPERDAARLWDALTRGHDPT